MTGMKLSLLILIALVSLGNSQGIEHSPIKVGLIQYDGDKNFGDYEYNIEELTKLAMQAVERGAQVIQLPEGALWGYASPTETWCRPMQQRCGFKSCRDVSLIAEDYQGGDAVAYWQDWAESYGMVVVFNLPEVEQGQYFNTTFVVNGAGIINKYRKRKLYWVDKCYASSGQKTSILEFKGYRFGLLTCMDANSLGLFREYRERDVDGILITMDWDQDPNHHVRAARHFFRARAIKSQLPLLVSDVSPWDGTGLYWATGQKRVRDGMSQIAVGQDGVVVVDFAK
jgi:N-carbamoylputrescine amidase